MSVKSLFTKRVRRYACAALASAVTTFIGWETMARAEAQTCSLRDATAWQVAITDAEIELTPSYIRFVTEAFLRDCPERPEFASASRVAGIAATDMGDADAALRHFENAAPLRDQMSGFYAIAASLAANADLGAWRVRDQMVATWLTQLERHPGVSVSPVTLDHGTIYQLHFTGAEAETRAAWVAVPRGPGWPATISFSTRGWQAALRRISDDETDDIRYVELNRCYGRRTLGRLDGAQSSVDFDGAAQAGLTAYLAAPDVQVERSDTSISPCVLHARLLPVPARF